MVPVLAIVTWILYGLLSNRDCTVCCLLRPVLDVVTLGLYWHLLPRSSTGPALAIVTCGLYWLWLNLACTANFYMGTVLALLAWILYRLLLLWACPRCWYMGPVLP